MRLRILVAGLMSAFVNAALPAAAADSAGDASPNGRIAFTSSWDAEIGDREPRIFRTHLRGNRSGLAYGFNPVVSPDGTTILFHDPDSSIWRVNLDGKGRRKLTNGTLPAWSPDGKSLAFVDSNYGISTVAASGEKLQALPTGSVEGAPVWSPNGRWIAYVHSEGVMVIRPDGTGVRRLHTGALVLSTLSWSPDGARLAFAAEVTGDSESGVRAGIVTVGVAGERGSYVTARRGDSAPQWSPDGRRIAFVRSRAIVTVRADGGAVTVLTRPGGLADSRPSWSPNGRLLAFARGNSPWVVPASGGRAKPVRREDAQAALGTDGSRTDSFRWLPDGRSFVYTLELVENDTEIYSIAADGRNLMQLTRNDVFDLNPAYSPDGEWIVFERGLDTEEGIFLMRSDGKGLRRLSRDGASPSWSPDGSRIMFTRPAVLGDESGFMLYTIRPDGTHLTAVRNSIMPSMDDAVWSPHGRSFAFIDQGMLGVARLGTKPDWFKLAVAEAAFSLSWSPSGNRLAFGEQTQVEGGAPDEVETDVFTVAPTGTDVRKLVSGAGHVVWAPDGSRLAVIGVSAPAELRIVGTRGRKIRSLSRTHAEGGLSWQPRCQRAGGPRRDRLAGSPAGGLVCGLGGNDVIIGGPGADRLFGHEGDDSIDVRRGGFDVVGCGPGSDTVLADRADFIGVDCERVKRS